MTVMRRARAGTVVAFLITAVMVALAFRQLASASYTTFAPTQGDIDAKISAFGPQYRDHNARMIWQTSSSCTSSSRLYNFCSGIDKVFEHEIWLDNRQTQYPEAYRWAHWNQGYSTNLPGGTYIDVPDSDPWYAWGITVGTVDADDLQPYVWYYANMVSDADGPGPNWYFLNFQVGDRDVPGCITGNAWCMLSPDETYQRILLNSYYTFPNHLYWYGPY